MRIGVSLLNFRPGCMGGIETYYRELIQWLPQCATPNHEIVFFVNRELLADFPNLTNVAIFDCSARFTVFWRVLEAFTPYRCKAIREVVKASEVDVMFFPHQAMFPFPCPVPSVITVHDLQHVYFPQHFSLFDKAFRATVWKKSLLECNHIIAISNATAKSLMGEFGVDSSRISVVHHGVNVLEIESVEPPCRPGSPYFYYPAASYPHKGHLQLVQSFSSLKQKGYLEKEKLVFTGMKTDHWNKVQRWINTNGMEQEINHYGHVPYAEVLSLYKNAKAILFPTEFEGFGIPVLEAIQFRKIIICSRVDVFSEIGVPDSAQIDFSDSCLLLAALSELKETKLGKVPVTWEAAICETLDVILRNGGLDEAG